MISSIKKEKTKTKICPLKSCKRSSSRGTSSSRTKKTWRWS